MIEVLGEGVGGWNDCLIRRIGADEGKESTRETKGHRQNKNNKNMMLKLKWQMEFFLPLVTIN